MMETRVVIMSSSDDKKESGDKRDDEEALAPITGKRVHRRMGDIHGQQASSSTWLVSFTDVMALMLTFFVLLFSMAEPETQNWSKITSAMQSEFNKFYGAPQYRGTQDAVNIDKIDFDQALNIGYLASLMETVLDNSKLMESITLTPQHGQLIISLPRDLLFDPGEANIKKEGTRALYALGGSLSRIRNKIEIAGHADPRPVSKEIGEFDSNWDLSMARAANVSALLENVGYEGDVTILGHSSGRYDDLKGIVEEGFRLELSRRVDIIVMDHDGSKQKVFSDIEFE